MLRTALATGSATVTNAVKAISHADFGFSTAELVAARKATLSVIANTVMVTWDGTDPTITLGHSLLAAGQGWQVVEGNGNIIRLKFIRLSGDGVVTITLER